MFSLTQFWMGESVKHIQIISHMKEVKNVRRFFVPPMKEVTCKELNWKMLEIWLKIYSRTHCSFSAKCYAPMQ